MTRLQSAVFVIIAGLAAAGGATAIFLAPPEGSVRHYMMHCEEVGGEWLYGASQPTCISPDSTRLSFNQETHQFTQIRIDHELNEPVGTLEAQSNGACASTPTFSDYSVDVYQGRVAAPDFSSNEAATHHRTAITRDVNRGVNFAGKYVFAEWGCSEGCYGMAIVDADTGEIYEYGETTERGYVYETSSNLLGFENNDETTWFVWENETLKIVCTK